MMRIVILLAIALALVGCTNPYAKYYNANPAPLSNKVIEPTGEPVIRVLQSDFQKEYDRMKERGYILLGYSAFNTPEVSDSQLLEQAKKVKAAIVTVVTKYTGTKTSTIPITTPDNRTTYTNTYGNVYGYGGSASYYGTGYSTTYGSKTTYIPYSVSRYDYIASFWAKGKQRTFGAIFQDVPSEIKSEMESNKGLSIRLVVIGSPAYKADILNGDVLLKIGSVDIYDTQSMMDGFLRYAGKEVNVEIYRDGKIKVKSVLLNKPSD